MGLTSNCRDVPMFVIYFLSKIRLNNLYLFSVAPERKHIYVLSSRITRIVLAGDWVWTERVEAWLVPWPDIWCANLYVPPQDSSSKEVPTQAVLALVLVLSKKY